jgi:hypothetical protein
VNDRFDLRLLAYLTRNRRLAGGAEMEGTKMSGTTIAQALRHAKKLKGRIDEARTRAAAAVQFFADSPPAFDFDAQEKRASDASDELADLQGKLGVANATNFVDHGGTIITLAHAVRLLQELKSRIAWLRALQTKPAAQTVQAETIYMAGGHQTVARAVECKLPEATKGDRVDALQDRFDTLNAAVEALNQTVTI